MPVTVSFADLTHMGQMVAANTVPLGLGYLSGYARQELGDEIDFEIFKYPDDFADYLDKKTPQIACFSTFAWNLRIHHEYAKHIKAASPGTVTVFGGPNFPGSPEEQKAFLEKFSFIDFYVEFEGEIAFVELFRALKEVNFDVARFKAERRQTSSLRYVVDGEFVQAPLVTKITDLTVLPSPHLTGLLDKFYDDVLIPMMQSTRGCPYHCAFCWEGGPFFTKIKRFPQERVRGELNYIADRVKKSVHDLLLVDANFGMFEEDLDTAREVLKVQAKQPNQWPRTVLAATAKNHKERTIEIVEMLGETLPPTAAVQSTNEVVLAESQRKNVSLDTLITLARNVDKHGGQSEAEVILCLPMDTREAHFQSVGDMLDAGMTFIRMYQFMLLPGTAMASRASRDKHKMVTRYRVLPRCFGRYRFRDQVFPVAEIEEIGVANATMPYEHYQDCRDLNLTVETFNNDSIFADITRFLALHGIRRSQWVREIYEIIHAEGGPLAQLYADYRVEEKKNLWLNLAEIEAFVAKPGVIERYIEGEYGTNELYKYRALAVFEHLERLHDVAYNAARKLLSSSDKLTKEIEEYLAELERFSRLRKQEVLNTSLVMREKFHYDFVAILEDKFINDPFLHRRPEGVEIELFHTSQQQSLIAGYMVQYPNNLLGLGRILLRANMNRLYRRAR
jgi:radical SAM superfamily enzyme YgiQ (UPF0313 family)